MVDIIDKPIDKHIDNLWWNLILKFVVSWFIGIIIDTFIYVVIDIFIVTVIDSHVAPAVTVRHHPRLGMPPIHGPLCRSWNR